MNNQETKFAWLLELIMPSGTVWYFSENKGSAALVQDANYAIHFQTEDEANKYLQKIRSQADSKHKKLADELKVREHGFVVPSEGDQP